MHKIIAFNTLAAHRLKDFNILIGCPSLNMFRCHTCEGEWLFSLCYSNAEPVHLLLSKCFLFAQIPQDEADEESTVPAIIWGQRHWRRRRWRCDRNWWR